MTFPLLIPFPPQVGRLAFSTFGLMYALTASRLIIAHMCKEPVRPPLVPLVMLTAGVVACSRMGLQALLGGESGSPDAAAEGTFGESSWAVILVFAVSLAWYLTYVCSVVVQISTYLGIHVLSIAKRPR